MNSRAIPWLAAYIGSIVAANWMTTVIGLVPIGLGLSVTAGTFAAGAALVLRDAVQMTAGKITVLAAIAVGSGVSYLVADPMVAVASAAAFAASELADFAVFTPLRNRSLSLAVVVSSVVSAPIDTVLFLSLAGFGVTWQAVLGQFLVKTAMALLAALYLSRRGR